MLNKLVSRILLVVFIATALSIVADAQQPAIVINVKDGPQGDKQAVPSLINGYRERISGGTISYHSSHPEATEALLARASKGESTIEWETDTIPMHPNQSSYSLIWLAGLDRLGWGPDPTEHKFTLFMDGTELLSFANRKGPAERSEKWQVNSPNGASLSFETKKVDKFGDVFGMMVLRLPSNLCTPGKPLRLKVVGADDASREWYMTFQYHFNFLPRVRPEPALLRSADGVKQMLSISADNLSGARSVEISVGGVKKFQEALQIGANIFPLEIPRVDTAASLPVTVQYNGDVVDKSAANILPVHERTVYLLSYSHNDIGYTDLQPNVQRKQWSNLEKGLELTARTRDYPPDARYKWNMEILWPLDGYLKQASAERQKEIFDAVRNGNLGLNALYVNPLTGLATAHEMDGFTAFARKLETEHSLNLTTALVSDIPGFTAGIVPALARGGVKYFASAPNVSDRIGSIYDQGDKPFYWTTPSGDQKVLFWLAGTSYSMFHEGRMKDLGQQKLFALMRRLDAQQYPYEYVQLPYTLGDNGEPDTTLSDFVRDWNTRYVSPHLTIATQKQMFEDFEKKYGASLPTHTCEITPYWEDGAASTALETAMSRNASDRLTQAEALWSLRSPDKYPRADFESAWRNVTLWDEHTWGASNSIDDPDSPAVKGQWQIKRQYALDADSLSRNILGDASSGKILNNAVDVTNTLSWPRTDVVYLSHEQSLAGDRVLDEHRKPVPSQRLSDGSLAVLIRDLASMSTRRLVVTRGKSFADGDAAVSRNRITTKRLWLSIDTVKGVIDVLHWKDSVELADAALNQYLYVAGTSPDSAKGLTNVTVRIKESGKLVSSLIVQGNAPGCRTYSSEIRLLGGIDRVDIIDMMDKLPIRTKEGVHIGFNFAVPSALVHYDVAGAVLRPEIDQMPGSCKNYFSIQNWIDASNEQYGVTLASPDAPLLEMGAINAEKPWMASNPDSPTFFSYVMNNYWHTNYKADQQGVVRFRYSVIPHDLFSIAQSVRAGMESRQPLVVTAASGKTPPTGLFSLNSPDVLATAVKPLADGKGWFVELYNPTLRPKDVVVEWNHSMPVSYSLTDAFEGIGKPIQGQTVSVPAQATVCLRIDRTK